MTVVYFFLALLILVLFHELGHFIVARMCGVKVLRFSFGFGKVLWAWRDKHNTEFTWSLLPLGGYVKMLDENVEPVAESEKKYAFNNKPLWAKTLIVLAGPVFNFILAFAFLWLVLLLGVKSIAPIIGEVQEDSLAAASGLHAQQEIVAVDKREVRSWRDFQYAIMPLMLSKPSLVLTVKSADGGREKISLPVGALKIGSNSRDIFTSLGVQPYIPEMPLVVGEVLTDTTADNSKIRPGDKIIAIDGAHLGNWMQLVKHIKQNPDMQMQVKLMRDDEQLTVPIATGHTTQAGKTVGILGIKSLPVDFPKGFLRTDKYPFFTAAYFAFVDTIALTKTTLILFGKMFQGDVSLKSLSGPVGIAQGASESASVGLVSYLTFLALLSVGLGVLNLLPIPLLDGGHLLFFLFEGILRRPVSDGIRVKGTYLGALLLIALTAVALTNDITKILGT